MAAINFPDPANNGDLHTEAGTTWQYDSTFDTWTVQRTGSLVPITTQVFTTASTSPTTSKASIWDTNTDLAAGKYLLTIEGIVWGTSEDTLTLWLNYGATSLASQTWEINDATGVTKMGYHISWAGDLAGGAAMELYGQKGAAGDSILATGNTAIAVKLG